MNFTLNDVEKARYEQWLTAHKIVCNCSAIVVHFHGGSVGTKITVSCVNLKHEHDLSDYDTW